MRVRLTADVAGAARQWQASLCGLTHRSTTRAQPWYGGGAHIADSGVLPGAPGLCLGGVEGRSLRMFWRSRQVYAQGRVFIMNDENLLEVRCARRHATNRK